MFLFQCYTGISFADLLQITYYDIRFPKLEQVKRIQKMYDEFDQYEEEDEEEDDENKEKNKMVEGCVIAFERQKTDNSCIIPLFGTAVELLIVQNMGIGGWEMSKVLKSEKERIDFLKQILGKKDKSIREGNSKRQIFPNITNQYYNREIKKILSDAIGDENKKKPLTDEALMELLKEKGYSIARRTVAKYREQLNIPVARLRKEL